MEVDTAPQRTEEAVAQPVWSLQRAMHRLWVDHAIWTRDYVVAALAGAPDAQAAAGRLLRNQEDIGNAIVPLYGEDAGATLTDLLKQHILIAVDLVDAAKKGDQRKFKREDKRWDHNAEEIAAFLAGANPNWPKDDVQDLLAQHLALTKQEVVARLEEEWDTDVARFDDIMTEILTLADALSAGIVQQFPERFGTNGSGDSTSSESPPERRGWSAGGRKSDDATETPAQRTAGEPNGSGDVSAPRRIRRPAPISRSSSGQGRPGAHGSRGGDQRAR